MKLVDTSVFVDAERRHSPAQECLADLLERRQLAVSAVTVFELTSGRTTPPGRLAHYAELFAHQALVLPVTHLAARLAAEAARLARTTVRAPDALIAGVALEHDLPVVTSDADFLRLPGLSVEWVSRPPRASEPEARYGAPARAVRAARDIGPRLRAARLAGRLRGSEVARAAGMARSNYARLESGRHAPRVETVLRVAAALGLPAAGLLEA